MSDTQPSNAEAKRKGFADVLVDGIKAIEYQGKVLLR